MKIITTLIILTLICSQSFSQSAYKPDVQPVIGEAYVKHRIDNANNLNPGSPGVGQTWDLSNAIFSLQNDYYYFIVDPASTPHTVPGASYVEKNYASWDTTYVGYEYFKDTADGYYALHEYGNVLEINYPSFEFIWKFPIIYGDSNVCAFSFSTYAFSITYNYTSTSKLSLDGAGTLLLGSGLIQNVVRFKYEQVAIRQSPNDTTYTTKYFWYIPGIHHPIADYTSSLDPNGTTYYSANLYTNSNTTEVGSLTSSTGIKFYLDRDYNRINIKSETGLEKLVVYDLQGKLIIEESIRSRENYEVNIDGLETGMYVLSVSVANRNSQWRFVKY